MKKQVKRLAQIALMLFVLQVVCSNLIAQPAPTTSGPFGSTLSIGANGETKYWDGAQWIAVAPGLPGQSLQFAPVWINNPQGITTTIVSSIIDTNAASGGVILSGGGAMITAHGVCWSTIHNPTLANSFTTNGTGIGSFTSNITGLTPGSTYYVRAYASNSMGTAYGNEVSFTTTGILPVLTIIDYDGNVYDTVNIGTQIWLKQNLKVTHYSNGDSIPNVTDDTEWLNLIDGAYCDYNNTPSNSATYGRLYNSSSASDYRNLCPTGWHVPSDAEWTILTTYLGSESIAGNKLKVGGPTGFSALPGGNRDFYGTYDFIGVNCYWWSSTEATTLLAWYRYMGYNGNIVYRSYTNETNGYSVRCIKNQ